MTSQPTSHSPLDDIVADGPAPQAMEDHTLHQDESLDWLAEPDLPAERGAGGRMVLGWTLSLLAIGWVGFSAWSAGQALSVAAISSPAIAQWLAIAAGPLALIGLLWLVFGRTRRKEAENFTRSVVTMRQESRSLEALLAVLRQRIDDNHAALRAMSTELMSLGDEATHRLGADHIAIERGGTRPCKPRRNTRPCRAIGTGRYRRPARKTCRAPKRPRRRWHCDCAMPAARRANRPHASNRQVATLTQSTQEAGIATGNATEKLLGCSIRLQDRGAKVATDLRDIAAIVRFDGRSPSGTHFGGTERNSVGYRFAGACGHRPGRPIGSRSWPIWLPRSRSASPVAWRCERIARCIFGAYRGAGLALTHVAFGYRSEPSCRSTSGSGCLPNKAMNEQRRVGATLAMVRAELDAIGERSGASDDVLASIGGRAEGLRHVTRRT